MKVADYLVLMLAVSLVLWLAWQQWFADRSLAARVVISSGTQEVAVLPLNQDKVVEIEGQLGVSTIEVKDGQVRFVDSPCSNRQCILRGWAQHTGDAIACLPNRVSLTIIGQDTYFDAVNF